MAPPSIQARQGDSLEMPTSGGAKLKGGRHDLANGVLDYEV